MNDFLILIARHPYAFALALYAVPAGVALIRRHRQATWILALCGIFCVLPGFLISWTALLIWAIRGRSELDDDPRPAG